MADYFDAHSGEWDQKKYRIERAQTVAEAIKAAIPLTGKSKVLDFGCGTGLLGLNLADSVGEIWLGDTSEGMLSETRKKIQAQGMGNAFTINLDREEQSQSYDAIVCLMVLHHIDRVEAQIERLCGWIVPEGYIVLCDLDKEDGSFHQGEQDAHNGFEREFIRKCLEENRVTVLSDSTVYMNRKIVDGAEREYPVFMIVGRKIAEK